MSEPCTRRARRSAPNCEQPCLPSAGSRVCRPLFGGAILTRSLLDDKPLQKSAATVFRMEWGACDANNIALSLLNGLASLQFSSVFMPLTRGRPLMSPAVSFCLCSVLKCAPAILLSELPFTYMWSAVRGGRAAPGKALLSPLSRMSSMDGQGRGPGGRAQGSTVVAAAVMFG